MVGLDRRARRAGLLAVALLLWLGALAPQRAFPVPVPALASGSAAPNRFDPTSRAASVPAAPAARPAASTRRSAPVRRRPAPALMQPGTIALDPSKPAHFASSDSALEVDVPAGAVSAADVAAAGGSMSLLVRQVAPASGGTAGGSGHFTFGTFLVQALDAGGRLARQGLRQPVSVKLHYGSRAGALDVTRAVAVVNRPAPRGVELDPVRAMTAPLAGGQDAAAPAPAPALGRMVRQQPAVDLQSHTLTTTADSPLASTTVSFDTAAPVAAFGGPDRAETNLSAGGLTMTYPLRLPAGPGGLTPPLSLVYDSAGVSDQHNVAAAAPWVGEGWNLSLGRISWAERDVALGCCPNPEWDDTWQLVDGFGTDAELIPPSMLTSTYYEDFNGTSITPSPLTWHTTPESHARVISYTGPNALAGMAARPPCFRVFLPTGIMEEFGCTPDSLQFYPQSSGPETGLDFIANWLLDLITDPRGNQIHVTYQRDVQTGAAGISYPRDAEMATVEYDSPGCHDARAACTGAAWAPLMRVSFQASHSVARVAGSGCAANGSLRCDDPVDLSASGGLAPPSVENTFVLNDALVQVRAGATAAWKTLRDYQLAYDQAGPSTITDPFSGLAQSTAGRLDLTRLTEVGADGSTALPGRSFGYTRQVQWYEDEFWGPAPANNCGPSWNVGSGQGCNLWSRSYEGNSYYLSTASNGLGLQQSFTWQLARDNARGVPSGDVLDPFVCDSQQSTSPCDLADAGAWSRMVLVSRSESVTRLSQAGQGGAQTSTPVTGTTTYGYRLMPIDDYWGDWFDADVVDFYNGRFMGFGTVTVTNPDGSREVHQFPGSEGFGVFDPNDSMFSGFCTAQDPCPKSPWWDAANAEHGRETEVDRYNPDGSLQEMVQTRYQLLCPPTGVAPDAEGNLLSELDDGSNSVAACDIAPSQVDQSFVDGGAQASAPHLTTSYAYDSYGRVTSSTETSGDGAGGSPTTIVRRASYAWNDGVTATATSATGTYLVDFPAFADVEDAGGSRYRCTYMSYDGRANVTGQTSGLTAGEATRSDVYTSCGTAANGFTPSGQISGTQTYDAFGNPVASDDPDALAGSAAHLGCTVGSSTFSSCTAYDGTFASLPTSVVNALGQRISTGYQAPASGSPTDGFGLWPTSTTDANGQATTHTYDALGRRTGETEPGETAGLITVATAYTVWCSATGAQSPCVEIDRTQRLNSSTTVTARAFYDGLGHLVETRTPAPGGKDVVRYSFRDPSERLAFQSVPYLVTAYTGAPGAGAYSIPDSTQAGTTFTYDGLGRTTSTTDALSHASTSAYSVTCAAAGTGDAGCYRQVLTVDRDGHRSGTLLDALGRTAYEQRYTGSGPATYALYSTARYAYDFVGDLVEVLHPDGVTRTTVQHDMAGRETALTDPDLGTRSYAYDPDGNVVQSVDARGAAGTVFIGYDGLDRPLWHNTVNSPSGAYYTYSYDSTANGNPGVGRLTGETFSGGAFDALSGSYGFTYDARGRKTGQTLTVGGTGYPVVATYDDAGHLLTRAYPDGETVTSSYGAQGWLSGVSTQQGSTTTTLLGSVSYGGVGGAFGDITGAAVGGGALTYSATDDLLGRVTDLKLSAGGSTVFEQARTFDAVGSVTAATTTLPAGTDTQAFCYDEQNRLTWAGSVGTPPCTGGAISAGTLTAAQYTQSFTYDTLGRLATGPLGGYQYGDSAHAHAATAVGAGYTAAYDPAGDMTCRAPTASTTCAGGAPNGAQLVYDNEGQLMSWQSAPANADSSEQFLYDCQGQRIAQQVTRGGTTTITVSVGGLEDVSTSGGSTTTRTYYYAAGRRIATAAGGVLSYLASDGLGSANVAAGSDGSAMASQLYAPYGQVRYASGAMPTDYGFTGQRGDAASGLDYYGARYYDPAAGQFTSADTVVPGGGFNLGGLSRYAYTRGNPVSRVDPGGHDDFGDFGDFGGDFGGFDFGGFDSGAFDSGGFDSFDSGSGFDDGFSDTGSSFDESGFEGFDSGSVDDVGTNPTVGDDGSISDTAAQEVSDAPGGGDQPGSDGQAMASTTGAGGDDPQVMLAADTAAGQCTCEQPRGEENLYNFGNASGPRVRMSDFGVDSPDAMIGPFNDVAGPSVDIPGTSVFRATDAASAAASAGLSGVPWSIPADTQMPPGLGLHYDGVDVGGGAPFGHGVIFPTEAMTFTDFQNRFLSLPWAPGARIR